MQLRGVVLKFSGRSDLAERGLTEAVEAARRSGDDVSHVRCLVALASIRADVGDAATSRRLCEEALDIARRTHDVGVQRSAYLNLLRALVAQGELALAVAAAQEAMDLSPRYTNVGEEQALSEARFVLALMAGELGTAFDAAPALLDVSRRAGELWRRVSGLLAPVDAWLLLDSRRDDAAALIDEADACLGDSGLDLMRLAVAVRRAELALLRGDAPAAAALIAPVAADPALRAQDLAHAQRVLALARQALGEPAALAAPTPDMNPEPATLNAAARLRIDPSTVDEALAWFDSGRATPLEALHLALALRQALPARRRADRRRLDDAAHALATRLHDSLATHPDAQADFRRQFAPLLQA
jgi:tetratricopeptide (TPR) repeat protein